MLIIENKTFYFLILALSYFIWANSIYLFETSGEKYLKNAIYNNKDNDKFKRVQSSLLLSMILGSFIGTFTIEIFNKQLLFAAIEFILAILLQINPFVFTHEFYLLISLLVPFLSEFLRIIINIFAIELFRESNFFGSYLQILYFFQSSFYELIFEQLVYSNFHQYFKLDDELIKKFKKDTDLFKAAKYSKLWIVFMVMAFFKFLISILLIYGYKKKPLSVIEDEDLIEIGEENDSIFKRGKKNLSKEYVIIFLLLVYLIFGIESIYEFKNSLFYLFHNLKNSDDELFGLTFSRFEFIYLMISMIARLVNILFTLKIETHTMLTCNFVTILIGNLLLILSNKYVKLLGIGLKIFGLSNLNPMIIIFIEQRIKLSTKKLGFLFFIQNLSFIFSNYIYSLFVDDYHFKFTTINLIVITILFLLFLFLTFYLERKRLTNENLITYIQNHLYNSQHLPDSSLTSSYQTQSIY